MSRVTGEGRPRPFLRALDGLIALIAFSGKAIAVAMLGFTFVTLLINVILRYAFGSGIAWAYEIHSVTLPWLVAGGLVVACAQGRNIAVTLVSDLVAPSARRWIALAVNAIVATIAIEVLLSSQPILKASTFQTLSTLGIRQVWGYSSLVYAFAGMALVAVLDILRLLGGAEAGPAAPEAASFS